MAGRGSRTKRGLWRDVRRALNEESGRSIVPAAFLAFAVLDMIPTPTDIGYFRTQQWLAEHGHELTPGQRRAAEVANYYGWDVLWYLSLFGITYTWGTDAWHQLKLGAAVVGTGGVIALASGAGGPRPNASPWPTPDRDRATLQVGRAFAIVVRGLYDAEVAAQPDPLEASISVAAPDADALRQQARSALQQVAGQDGSLLVRVLERMDGDRIELRLLPRLHRSVFGPDPGTAGASPSRR